MSDIEPRDDSALVPAEPFDLEAALDELEAERGEDPWGLLADPDDEWVYLPLLDPIKAQLAEAERSRRAGPRRRLTADDL